MRFTIVLALCFIGAVSAGSLNKRSFIDDFQNNTQNAFHAFEQFGQSFNEKVQEALKNLLSAFGNKEQSTEASVNVVKRDINPFVLFDDLIQGDIVSFARDYIKILAAATLSGRRKRDLTEDLKNFSEEAKDNAEEALKKLFSLFEQFKPQSSGSSDITVVKRSLDPFVLFDDVSAGDTGKFFKDLLTVLSEITP